LIGLFQNVFNDTTATALNEAYVANGRNFGVASAHNNPFQATLTLRWRNNVL
jgi:hypothetical protein